MRKNYYVVEDTDTYVDNLLDYVNKVESEYYSEEAQDILEAEGYYTNQIKDSYWYNS